MRKAGEEDRGEWKRISDEAVKKLQAAPHPRQRENEEERERDTYMLEGHVIVFFVC